MNLLKTTFLAYISALIGTAAVVNAQDDTEPSVPNLNGQNFKITVRRDFVLCQKFSIVQEVDMLACIITDGTHRRFI